MSDKREEIMAVARTVAQSRGYNGLSFRELAKTVGVKSASIHYHFPTKEDLGAALARRYREDAKAALGEPSEPYACINRFVESFRLALERNNRMCLCGIMAAEYDDLPDAVKAEVVGFADDLVAWLSQVLARLDPFRSGDAIKQHAFSIYAAVGGAQLTARGRGNVSVFDQIIEGYRLGGLLPTEVASTSRDSARARSTAAATSATRKRSSR
jgi:TetR/AcrR family transcriptional regulator, transcriptional repressor for nem operon